MLACDTQIKITTNGPPASPPLRACGLPWARVLLVASCVPSPSTTATADTDTVATTSLPIPQHNTPSANTAMTA
eukprot:scaffold15319_cov101-Isochrysis_galbana.AAC.1